MSGFNVIGGAAAVAGVCLVGAAVVVVGAVYGIYKMLQGLFALAEAAHGAYTHYRDRRQAELAERARKMVSGEHRTVEELMKRVQEIGREVAGDGGEVNPIIGKSQFDEINHIQDELTRIEQHGRVRQGAVDSIRHEHLTADSHLTERPMTTFPAIAGASPVLPYTGAVVHPSNRHLDSNSGAVQEVAPWPEVGHSPHDPSPWGSILGTATKGYIDETHSSPFDARMLLYDRMRASGAIVDEATLLRLECLADDCRSLPEVESLEIAIESAVDEAREFQIRLDKDRQRAVECLNMLDVVETIYDGPLDATVDLRRQLELTLTSRQEIADAVLARVDAETTVALRELFDRNIPCVKGAGVIEVRTQYRSGEGVVTTVTPTCTRRMTRGEKLELDREACRITESMISRFEKLGMENLVRREAGVGTFEPALCVEAAVPEGQVYTTSRKRRDDAKVVPHIMKRSFNDK